MANRPKLNPAQQRVFKALDSHTRRRDTNGAPLYCCDCGANENRSPRSRTSAQCCPCGADCLVILPYALADLGHAIARFVRRATVAELVEIARRGHNADCAWWDDDECNCSVKEQNEALQQLARLAEEVSGG